jgi:putative PIN family toxin of toxin-antitoxin system
MKIFFDTCVYAAESLLGAGAEEMLRATQRASWRIFASDYLLDELDRVLTQKLGFRPRLAQLARQRIIRRAELVEAPSSAHVVPTDSADCPILQAAMAARADYLVTNDSHLLALNPYEGLRIVSMTEYYHLLQNEGLIES